MKASISSTLTTHPKASIVPSKTLPPSVGIFWGVLEKGRTVLVTDRSSLGEAEAYGDCLTHSRGHYEVWEAWRRLGATVLGRQGLPPTIADHEYEAFPRGRVVYMCDLRSFTIYADQNLQQLETIAELLRLFGLAGESYLVRADAHYRTFI
ncbi:hypothetical protein [Methylobacterium sp. Leaf465]|uniref:hypothetical protein n=1 Tax=Methylobacterium sp. Leaf465 TaxID=1736385 RepID=UPI000A7AB157|nr:hypothetical protein [Methylobacterium sp. Leaf465]